MRHAEHSSGYDERVGSTGQRRKVRAAFIGHQQRSLFNARYDRRCLVPVHVHRADSARPVAVLLRPGKTPSGPEVRTLLKHPVRCIRLYFASACPDANLFRLLAGCLAAAGP